LPQPRAAPARPTSTTRSSNAIEAGDRSRAYELVRENFTTALHDLEAELNAR
jgi:DNA-binding GntR family transcriptional regulator